MSAIHAGALALIDADLASQGKSLTAEAEAKAGRKAARRHR